MNALPAPQRTDEWFQARCGKVTASRIADLMARTKTGWSSSRANYMAQLVAERLTGEVEESYVNDAMKWGTEQEGPGRFAYQLKTGNDVEETGFLDHPTIAMSGASPDGLVGQEGLIEIKCPNTATHIDTILTESIQQKYMLQMQWQMAVTGRKFCDFVSFDPRMPERMSIWVHRVERDQNLINEIQFMVIAFLAEVDERVTALTRKYG